MAIPVKSSQGYTKNGTGISTIIVNDGNIYLGPTSTSTLGTINLFPVQLNIMVPTTFCQCERMVPSSLSVASTNASKSYTKIVNDGNISLGPTSTSMLVTINQLSKQLSIMVATETTFRQCGSVALSLSRGIELSREINYLSIHY